MKITKSFPRIISRRVSSNYLGGVPPSRTLRGSPALGRLWTACWGPAVQALGPEEARHKTSETLGGCCQAANERLGVAGAREY